MSYRQPAPAGNNVQVSEPVRPALLGRRPSLNRMILAALPGAPPGVPGKRAGDWLTARAIASRLAEDPVILAGLHEVQDSLPDLPETNQATPHLKAAATDYPAALDTLLRHPEHDAYAAATGLAQLLGTTLGLLVATCVTGPADVRAVHHEWPEERWALWSQVRRVALGGGIVRGALGRIIVDKANEFVCAADIPVTVALVDDPVHLVLRGAAGRCDNGIAVDAGGTTIKRAPVQGSRIGAVDVVPAPDRVSAADVVAVIAAAAAPLVREHSGPDPVPVGLALATYVDATGQPYAGQLGPYAPLGEIDAPAALAEALGRHTGRRVALTIAHDGACALRGARLEIPAIDAAIVLGTALGSGVAG